MRYYLDTCVWRDFYENRIGFKGKLLGSQANELFLKIIKRKDKIIFSDFVVKELKKDFTEQEINEMLTILFFSKVLEKAGFSEKDYKEAKKIGLERNIPPGDVLHAIISKNSNSILVSQDNHINKLNDIVKVMKPEEII